MVFSPTRRAPRVPHGGLTPLHGAAQSSRGMAFPLLAARPVCRMAACFLYTGLRIKRELCTNRSVQQLLSYIWHKDCKAFSLIMGLKCSSRYASPADTYFSSVPYSDRILHTLLNCSGVWPPLEATKIYRCAFSFLYKELLSL